MAEISAYFEAITAVRSMRVTNPFDASNETISAETQMDLARDSVGMSLRTDLETLLPYVAQLCLEDQELLKCYFLLEKPQWCLAVVHRSTQTLCSQRIRKAQERLGLIVQHHGQHPPLESITEVLEQHGLNHILAEGPTTAEIVVEYRKRRSFTGVSDSLRCPRAQVRHVLNTAATALKDDEHREHAAYGAYIHGLIDQAAVHGRGFSENKRQKLAHAHAVDPDLVGQFRVNGSHVDAVDHILVSRASL